MSNIIWNAEIYNAYLLHNIETAAMLAINKLSFRPMNESSGEHLVKDLFYYGLKRHEIKRILDKVREWI